MDDNDEKGRANDQITKVRGETLGLDRIQPDEDNWDAHLDAVPIIVGVNKGSVKRGKLQIVRSWVMMETCRV